LYNFNADFIAKTPTYQELAVKAQQEDKAVRINITLPRSLLEAIDARANQLHINRSMLIQKAAREVI
jgi:predicted DNA binding CopG/RHH family protein